MDLVGLIPGNLNAYDYEDITIDTTAGGKKFTVTKVSPTTSEGYIPTRQLHARLVIAVVEGATIRYTMHPGGAPVAGGPGLKAVDGAILSFASYNLMQNFRAIQDGGSPATLRVTYFR